MKNTIKEFCKKIGITEDQLKGSLDLKGTGITSLPDNLTVGGYLHLRGTGITSLPDNLTVGGYLYLKGTGITSLPDNLTVGGSLDLEGTGITSQCKKLPSGYLLSWQGGKYLLADGIFTEVVSHRGNVYHVRKIAQKEILYLITDGNGKWSHGATLEEAKSDLMFKISNRTKDDYKSLNLTDVLKFEDAIMCYRVITGACSFGTKDFISNRLVSKKSKYSIAEIIEVTKGEYGSREFANFFAN